MPSSPKKQVKGREVISHAPKDSDTDDSMPPLVDSSAEESRDEDSSREAEHDRKATCNAESVEMWLDMSKAARERQMHVMRVYLLSPFLFGTVEQEDKWINWAHACGLLPSNSNFDLSSLSEEYFEAVDIVEDAFNKLVKHLLEREDGDEIEKLMGMIDKISAVDKLEKATTCAESFTLFGKIRDKMRSTSKRKGDTALLLALQQAYDHIRKLTREHKDLAKVYDDYCRQGEKITADSKKQGNENFRNGKYKAAISAYTRAIHMGQFNYILYGNRAQSYLKSGDLREALVDGRRAVVLKPDWTKAQYRYAQAFFDLGDYERAVNTNRAARKICTGKDSKDLDAQYDKFIVQKEKSKNTNDTPGKSPSILPNGRDSKKNTLKNRNIDDLPDLVEAKTSDTSGESDLIDDIDDMPDMISDDSDGNNESPPDLVTESSNESDSEKESDDSITRAKKHTEEELQKQLQRKVKLEKKAKAVKVAPVEGKREARETRITEREKRKQERIKKKREKAQEENKEPTPAKKKRELMATVRQGSNALLENKHKTSVHCYSEALKIIAQDTFEKFEIKQIDYILILYAHGTACLETGIYKELLEAIRQFETIIIQYKDNKFPLAFYGLGRVYHRQNRFTEALEPLNQGLSMVNSAETFGLYRWPASQTVIEETRPGKLKIAFEAIIAICKHPPRADAICRYSDCSGRTQIYLSDPDYKGFVRLVCDESCKVDYHPSCWKKFKTSYDDKGGDKDFLDGDCMTPDCKAPVVRIQIFGSSGLKTEFSSTSKTEGVTKPGKHGKTKTPGSQTKQTKHEKQKREKEDPKQEQVSSQDGEEERLGEGSTNIPTKPKVPVPNAPDESEEEKTVLKIKKPDTKRPLEEAPKDTNTQDSDAGVYIIRKTEEKKPEEVQVATKGVKGKSKKKKSKNTQSLDEFLKDLGGEVFKPVFSAVEDDLDEIPSPGHFHISPPDWGQHELEAPFAIPLQLRGQHQAFEAEYQAAANLGMFPSLNPTHHDYMSTSPIHETTLEYLLSMFKEILLANGELDIADSRIVEPVSYLPDSHQKAIEDSGGLKQFFVNSGQFVVKGNIVMLPEEHEFQQIIQNVNSVLGDGEKKTRNFANELDTYDDERFLKHQFQKKTVAGECEVVPSNSPPLKKSPLNPAVKEFHPKDISPSKSSNSLMGGPSAALNDEAEKLLQAETDNIDRVVTEKKLINGLHSAPKKNTVEEIKTVLTAPLEEVNPCSSPKDFQQNQANAMLMAAQESAMEVSSVAAEAQSVSIPKNGRLCELRRESEGSCQENLAAMPSPARHTRAGSNGSEGGIGLKSKGVQTQPQVKAKGVMTDPIAEPYKAEYIKLVQEKEDLVRKLQETQDKLSMVQSKHGQEVDKIKKKFTESQQEKEKLAKEIQSTKQDVKLELNKLREDCEEKKKLATSLEEHFKIEEDRYRTTINGLQEELTAAEDELSTEKAKWNTDVIQKGEAIKKMTTDKQQQETRAQEAETKLLELRRDVGLRFLERALQEASITMTNVAAYKSRGPAIPSAKLEELIASWRTYANETHQKIIQCKTSFDGQIQELKNGRVLSSLPQLAIPGPSQYPGPPILQPMGPQGQGQLQQSQLPSDFKPNVAQPSAPLPVAPPQGASAAAVTSQGSKVPQQVTKVAPQGPKMLPQGPKMAPQFSKVSQQAPKPTAEVPSTNGAAANSTGASDIKSRPSNSFEKIMLRLSTMYPYFSRSELTGFIKEVRQNKHGTLTGLSLEEIVASVADLVEAKRKVGLLRPPAVSAAGTPRSPLQSRGYPAQATNNNQQINKPTRPLTYAANDVAKAAQPPLGGASDFSKSGPLELDEDDPCVICHEDMNSNRDTVTLECGHKYHSPCIRKWLMGEQSTCPTCRVHALLPDEFPRLR